MNREFVNIKVDREEAPRCGSRLHDFRPGNNGRRGWPMSVWLTPQLAPFVGGTLFPPGRPIWSSCFQEVLQRIAEAWKNDRAKISSQGANIVDALVEAAKDQTSAGQIDAVILEAAYQQFARTFDAHEGGFGGAPKFPRPVTLNFLTRFHARNPDSDSGQHALEMVLLTLRKMAAGGIHDHIGGGFHRYSVDGHWHVPHFEKMLYDQAQLASAYLDAFQITGNRSSPQPPATFLITPAGHDFARGWILFGRRCGQPGCCSGGLMTAANGKSALIERRYRGNAEGAFYVWTKQEIDDALGEDAPTFSFHYGVEENGNAPAGPSSWGICRQKHLIERYSLAETARFRSTGVPPVGQQASRR
jgi:uncharacterized protein YyaL (SSP411 family)